MGLLNKKNDIVKDVTKEKSKEKKKQGDKSVPSMVGKTLSSWLYQPALMLFLVLIVSTLAIEFLFVQALESRQQKNIDSLVVSSLKSDLDGYLDERASAISSLAVSDLLQPIDSHTQDFGSVLNVLTRVFPELESAYLLSSSALSSIRVDHPEMSFASVDLIRKVAVEGKLAMEAFFHQKKWRYQIVAPVPGLATESSGVFVAVFDVSKLESLLTLPSGMPKGKVSLYRDGGIAKKKVASIGEAVSRQYASESTNLGGWQVRFTPSESQLVVVDRLYLWLLLGLAGLVSILGVAILCRKQLSRLRSDLILATQSLRFAISGEGKRAKGIYFSEVHVLEAAIRQLVKAGDRKQKQVVEKQALSENNSDGASDVPLFDDELLDLDVLADSGDIGVPTVEESDEMVQEVEQLDMDVPQSIFRAYDIRGVVDESLNDGVVELIGKALASEALAQGQSTLCVGYDGRLSSIPYCEAITRGIVSTGVNAIIIGQVPTPVLYFSTHELETGSGVMITGSHNPSNYNGFKMMIAGNTLSGDDIQKLYNRIVLQDFAVGQGERSERPIDRDYLDVILNDIAVAAPLKVVVDAGNGVAGELAPALIEELGCEVIPLFCEIDGTFPNHHPDPGKPENLQDLIAAVQEHNADIGLAFDGDGDRLGVVTNTGKIIWPDRLLMLFAKDVVSRNPGADVIFDVKCSRRLNGLISSYGGRPVMWKTGHSLIKSKMKETGALLAGEMSGHIFFKERWYGFDDGLYSAARLLEILGVEDQTADEVFAGFPEDISTPEINIEVTDESKFIIVAKLCELKGNFTGGNASTIDGLRVDYPNGWGLCRASNTTPVLVLRFEADDEDSLNEIKEKFKAQLLVVEPELDVNF